MGTFPEIPDVFARGVMRFGLVIGVSGAEQEVLRELQSCLAWIFRVQGWVFGSIYLGTLSLCPMRMTVPLKPLALCILETELRYLLAIPERVSPFRTVCVTDEGAAGFGFGLAET